LIGFGTDPDADGWKNAFEVLLGTDASTADAPRPTRFVSELFSGKIHLAYEFDVSVAGDDVLRFRSFGSSNLMQWAGLTNAPTIINQSNGWRTYRQRDDAPLNEAKVRTMRLGILPTDTPP
jgi:hypothetical protein